MNYQNPIIPGFHPDPSICRVGQDYYLVTSSFEYYPGIPLFHSRDLIHWEQLGHCIDREKQLKLRKGFPSGTGIYAPTIRYDNDTFYVISTNVTYGAEQDGNFLICTKDLSQGWSDPIFIDMPGIDPSLFFEDGHAYYTGAHNNQIIFCEIDTKTGKRLGDPEYIWGGTGGNDPEGPHIYKKDDFYYLMISEGGTEYGHMVTIARSRDIHGPYESCSRNPILSNRSRSTSIKATGHADLIQDHMGNWWAVCLGIRCITYPFKHNLGRETMLMPVKWEKDEFPVMASDGILEESYPAPDVAENNHWHKKIAPECLAGSRNFFDDFSENTLGPSWNFIYNPLPSTWNLTATDGTKGLVLHGTSSDLASTDAIAWAGRRQEHHTFTATTKLSFPCTKNGEEAGLTIYLNNKHHYEIALSQIRDTRFLLLRRQIGSLSCVEHMVAVPTAEIILKLHGTEEMYSFCYSLDGENDILLGQGECRYLTTEVGGMFTGNYIGLYATGNGNKCETEAVFQWFRYEAK